jgi:hypothetical protein
MTRFATHRLSVSCGILLASFLSSACAQEHSCDEVNCSVEIFAGKLGPFEIGTSKVRTLEAIAKQMPKSEVAPAPQHHRPISSSGEIMKLADAPVISVQGEYNDEYRGHPSAILEFADDKLVDITIQGGPHFDRLFDDFTPGTTKAIVLQKLRRLMSTKEVISANWLQEARAYTSGDLTNEDIAFLLKFDKFSIVEVDSDLMSSYELTFSAEKLRRVKLERTDSL